MQAHQKFAKGREDEGEKDNASVKGWGTIEKSYFELMY